MSRLSPRIALGLLAVLLTATTPEVLRGEEPTALPSVTITSPRGGQTKDRVVQITGSVSGPSEERLTLVLNGVPLSIPRSGDTFTSKQVLSPGLNTIRVVAEHDGRAAGDEVSVYAMVPPKDLRVTLTWDTAGTDVDLWVTGPDGEKVFYQHAQGAAGGTLDVDVTSGYGPETFTQAKATPGTYRVQAHYYSGGPPTRIELTVTQHEGTPDEKRRVFRSLLMAHEEVVEAGTFVIE